MLFDFYSMKRIKKPKKTSLIEDMTTAIKKFSKEEFGFQRSVIHKNKKKFDRLQIKRNLKREYENTPFNYVLTANINI